MTSGGTRYDAARWVRQAFSWTTRTVTPAGWLLLLVISLALAVGLPFGWVELVAPGILAAVLVLLALLFLIGKKNLRVELAIGADRVVVGREIDADLAVVNTGFGPRMPTQIDVPVGEGLAEVAVPFLRAGTQVKTRIAIPTSRRGLIFVGPASLTKSSPIGIISSEMTWGKAHRVYVYPRTILLPNTRLGLMHDLEGISSRHIVADDLSFHAIRDYAPGDSPRHIHWKSTAKTGSLMVRQYDQSVRSELMVVLDNNMESYLDEEEFELAVSAAASFALQGVTEGRNLSVISGPRDERALELLGGNPFCMGVTSRRALLDDMARLKGLAAGISLGALCSRAAAGADLASVVVIVSGSKVTPKGFQLAAFNFPVEVGVLAVRCDVESSPRINVLGDTAIATVALLGDLRAVLSGRAQR